MKAIVQIDIPLSKYNKDKPSPILDTLSYVSHYSKKSFKEYCSLYGHDHIVITEPVVNYSHPVWERLDFWFSSSWFEKYDEICYVDTDVYAHPESPDIFKACEQEKVFKRIPYHKADKKIKEGTLWEEVPERYKEVCFNAGVLLINKYLVEKTVDTIKDFKSTKYSDDSVLLNYSIMKSDIPVVNIDKRFNVKLTKDHLSGSNKDYFFLHAMGGLKITKKATVENFLRELYGK